MSRPHEGTLTRDEVAELTGWRPQSVRGQLRRWGIERVEGLHGPGGQAVYDEVRVREAIERAPGRGARTDLRTQEGPASPEEMPVPATI
ncbi:MAG: hypothetical protein K0R87_1850 [Pseudonocardia sp.]|nr:hypothetical protein [Pseudonocardia sp.]